MKIVYLHGFRGSANSSKAAQLRTWFGDENVLSPAINYQSSTVYSEYLKLGALLDSLLEKESDIFVVGSSFGGFMALNLFKEKGCKTLLINPGITAAKLEALTGVDATEVEQRTKDLELKTEGLSFWLATDDERLGPENIVAIKQHFAGFPITEFDHAGHRFTIFSKCEQEFRTMLQSTF